MPQFVHLVTGANANDRKARIALFLDQSRKPILAFSTITRTPYAPIDWLMGPGCLCCIPSKHIRHQFLKFIHENKDVRIIIDAGPFNISERIETILSQMPGAFRINVVTV